MRLKVVAEDFGLTRGINYGIYDACKNGIVTSVSMMMNTAHTDHAYSLVKDLDCSIGLSLSVTYGKALSDTKTLVEFDFLKPEHDYEQAKEDIILEYQAQVLKAKAMGIKISHLTTYKNEHLTNPVLMEVITRLGLEYDLPVRSIDDSTDVFKGQQASFDTLYQLFCQSLDYLELIVHPGFLDGHLLNISKYREWRMVEHSVLTSPIVIDMLDKHDLTLVS